jgi:hypothetical protein
MLTWSTIRSVLSITTKRKWKVKQIDVNIIFLNKHLKEEVYMEILEGFKGARDSIKVCKLNQILYGLK